MNLSIGPNVQSFSGRVPSKVSKSAVNVIKDNVQTLGKTNEPPVAKPSMMQRYFEYLVEGLEAIQIAITKR